RDKRQQQADQQVLVVLDFDDGVVAVVEDLAGEGPIRRRARRERRAEARHGLAVDLFALADELADDLVAFDGEGAHAPVGQLRPEGAGVDRVVGFALVADEQEEHDGQADKQHPAEEPTSEAHAAVTVGLAGSASLGFLTVLFRHTATSAYGVYL